MNRSQRQLGPAQGMRFRLGAVLVVLVLAYALLQPTLNRQLGWQLPSLTALMDAANDDGAAEPPANAGEDSLPQDSVSSVNTDDDSLSSASASNTNDQPANGSGAANRTRGPPANHWDSVDDLLEDPPSYLRLTGRSEFLSPGGIIYGTGSAEGHRLLHLARHLSDMPDRPGKHGVFEGSMDQVLTWIDDTFRRGRAGDSGSNRREEGDRTVYEATFEEELGFVGGREGNQRGHPPTRKIRLVVEGNRFITAFPF